MPRLRSRHIAASPQATTRPAGIPACLLAGIGRRGWLGRPPGSRYRLTALRPGRPAGRAADPEAQAGPSGNPPALHPAHRNESALPPPSALTTPCTDTSDGRTRMLAAQIRGPLNARGEVMPRKCPSNTGCISKQSLAPLEDRRRHSDESPIATAPGEREIHERDPRQAGDRGTVTGVATARPQRPRGRER
jgi:hypothetical protein